MIPYLVLIIVPLVLIIPYKPINTANLLFIDKKNKIALLLVIMLNL